jgi:hypothetical protein
MRGETVGKGDPGGATLEIQKRHLDRRLRHRMADNIGEEVGQVDRRDPAGTGNRIREESGGEQAADGEEGIVDELVGVGRLGKGGTFTPTLTVGAREADKDSCPDRRRAMRSGEGCHEGKSDDADFDGFDTHGQSLRPGPNALFAD